MSNRDISSDELSSNTPSLQPTTDINELTVEEIPQIISIDPTMEENNTLVLPRKLRRLQENNDSILVSLEDTTNDDNETNSIQLENPVPITQENIQQNEISSGISINTISGSNEQITTSTTEDITPVIDLVDDDDDDGLEILEVSRNIKNNTTRSQQTLRNYILHIVQTLTANRVRRILREANITQNESSSINSHDSNILSELPTSTISRRIGGINLNPFHSLSRYENITLDTSSPADIDVSSPSLDTTDTDQDETSVSKNSKPAKKDAFVLPPCPICLDQTWMLASTKYVGLCVCIYVYVCVYIFIYFYLLLLLFLLLFFYLLLFNFIY